LLLEAGADPNKKDDMGWTALKKAQRSGHQTIVELLKDRGAKDITP
jgi:ankyrin repeat protein